MDEKIKIQFKIKRKIFTSLRLNFLSAVNAFFQFFSLKKSRPFWGMVYDSVSKQPLDPVIVKLLYADGREVETCVTDLAGRYGFLARPGKFKIFARKTNYLFPSQFVKGDKDGLMEDLYHGEFFVLKEDSEVIAPNIPMDPAGIDWNQQAKQKIQSVNYYSKLLFKRLTEIIFWFGLVFSALLAFEQRVIWPNLWLIAVFVYLCLMMLALWIKPARLWGQIILKTGLPEYEDMVLELLSEKFPGMRFGKAVIHEDGKFLLRANPGRYLLSVNLVDRSKNSLTLGILPVRVGQNGVLNKTLVIKAKS